MTRLQKWINASRRRQTAIVYIGIGCVYALAPIDFLLRCAYGVKDAWDDTAESVSDVKDDLWTLVDAKSP